MATELALPGKVRQASYVHRLKAAGLCQVAVWVPLNQIADVHAMALELRQAAGITVPGEIVRCENQLSLPGIE